VSVVRLTEVGWAEEGGRHRGTQRLGLAALVEAARMAERGRLEALRECMMSGVTHVTMAVAGLFGERESGEQVNCVVSSMHQAYRPYAQLLTYRRGAGHEQFTSLNRSKGGSSLNRKIF
jgi:hypothetical protein